jgi:hypothetical protein
MQKKHPNNELFSWANEQGSTTMEFLFCAPALVMLMFVAMELNERIEQRVNLAISAGNTAWISKPKSVMQGQGKALESMAKADVLGTRQTGTNILATSNGDVLPDSNVTLSYTDTRRRADSYGISVESLATETTEQTALKRAKATLGDSDTDKITSGFQQFLGAVNKVAGVAERPKFAGKSIELFPDSPIEQHRVSWSLSEKGVTNQAFNALENLADFYGKESVDQLPKINSNQYRLLSHRTLYLKRDPGYHPDDYQWQAGIGLLAGTDEYSDWVDDCFMKLERNVCGSHNGFYDYLERTHNLIAFAKLLYDVISAALSSNPFTAASGIAMAKLKEDILNNLKIALQDEVMSAFSNLGNDLANIVDFGSVSQDFFSGLLNTNLEAELEQRMTSEMTNITQKVFPD